MSAGAWRLGPVFVAVVTCLSCDSLGQDGTRNFANTLGMNMIRIEDGSFVMGSDLTRDYWDEGPSHRVTISQPFFMSETEVTVGQYRQFRPDFKPDGRFGDYASGVSWYDAVEFCQWLSKKEGKTYRLPTEAQWEYACRAGTTTRYWSGEKPPSSGQANPWGLRNMHDGVREWCYDWYGEYPDEAQTDPVGPECGMARIVRGGCLDDDNAYRERKVFNAASSRAAIAPSFGLIRGLQDRLPEPMNTEMAAASDSQLKPGEALTHSPEDLRSVRSDSGHGGVPPGRHWIGFRVVQAPLPNTRPGPCWTSYARQGVRANVGMVKIGPGNGRPYFRKRYLLPVPLDNGSNGEIDAVGMHSSFRHHNHSPALEVCPNGDVLMVIYTSYNEYEPEVSLLASRLRFGAEEWDMPDRMFDFAAANDHAPLLWTDGSVVHFFWGNPRIDGGFPFQWTSSKDSGATWDEVRFPTFTNEIGPHSRQPINTAFRDKDGVMYVASDGSGGTSVLWASGNDGRTWCDTRGRSAGRHTTYALLSDGKTILGMGGKNTDIEGYMPRAISRDGGKTWSVDKSSFPAQGSNQRPSILRLQSGRLFFAGDYQHIRGQKPNAITRNGSYVALSDDDGTTWTVKTLAGAQPHENPRNHSGHPTLGYSVARQAPNGMIHLITTMNQPCLHFEFNEAWILSKHDQQSPPSDAELMASCATSMADAREYRETYPGGHPKITFSGGTANDGRFLLHGRETWYYAGGKKQREATYELGRKVGQETYWSQDGSVQWMWDHRRDGTSLWMQYWPNGRKRAESLWRNSMCDGTATLWDKQGRQISLKEFKGGKMQ